MGVGKEAAAAAAYSSSVSHAVIVAVVGQFFTPGSNTQPPSRSTSPSNFRHQRGELGMPMIVLWNANGRAQLPNCLVDPWMTML